MSPSISQAVRVLSAGLVPDFRDGSAGSADCQDMEVKDNDNLVLLSTFLFCRCWLSWLDSERQGGGA